MTPVEKVVRTAPALLFCSLLAASAAAQEAEVADPRVVEASEAEGSEDPPADDPVVVEEAEPEEVPEPAVVAEEEPDRADVAEESDRADVAEESDREPEPEPPVHVPPLLDDDPVSETPHPPGELELMDAHLATNVRFRPGRGLSISSDDGLFALNTRVRLQVLYNVDDVPGNELSHQLTLRRARLAFTGNFFGEDNRFKFELALSPRDEGIRDIFSSEGPQRTPLLDYYLEFRQLRELSVRIGQYKVPFSRQRVISSGNLQMVDRSIVNSRFNVDRDVGLDVRSRDLFGLGFLRYYLGVYIGQGRDAVGADDFGLMYIGRIEVLPFGMFDDYQEADFARSYSPRLSIGVAGAAIDRAHGDRGILGSSPADGGTTNTQHFAADMVFMYGGLSIFSEFMLRTGQRNPGGAVDELGMLIPTTPAVEGWGIMAQAGYLLPNLPIEITARYGTTQPLNMMSPLGEQSELGVGLNYYVAQHPFKIQLDAFRIWGDQFDVGTTRIRLQLQASI